MDNAFRLSLLYLLLSIPQHGNSPVPKMESWMEMDQGDGFVDRDMTSSLTGAESFGSAHKNYQNALIRKKQADTDDELRSERGMEEFSGRVPDRMQRRAAITPNFMQDQYASYGYNNYLGSNGPNQYAYPQAAATGMNGFQEQRYRTQSSNANDRAGNMRFDNRFPGSNMPEMVDSPMASNDARSVRINNGNARGGENALSQRMGKCFLAEGGKFGQAGRVDDAMANGEEDEYTLGSQDLPSRGKELNGDYMKDLQVDGGEEQDENLLRYNREEEEDLGIDENDYYNEVKNPGLMMRGDPDIDYSQINPHGIIYKREETKTGGGNPADGGEEVSQSAIGGGEGKGKSLKESRSLLRAEAPKEGRDITKEVARGMLQNSNAGHSINLNPMGDSERAYDQVRLSQKSPEKPQYYHGNVENAAKMSADETRNKREDEDEQKNMKTGTDEGGGEYEDEEGKGHNDEEEYYEEAEISGGRGNRAKTAFSGSHFDRKLHKRETGKDKEEKGSKGRDANVDVSSDEYELNLENAPVEHENDKCKKSSLREGKRDRKKNVARRGMKIWDEWGEWSPCSVTCGVGRKTRWRHCIGGGCARGEKEALIKKCTFPAC